MCVCIVVSCLLADNHHILIIKCTSESLSFISGYATIDDNVFKVSGKMLLLDRMLPKLIDEGHKVMTNACVCVCVLCECVCMCVNCEYTVSVLCVFVSVY